MSLIKLFIYGSFFLIPIAEVSADPVGTSPTVDHSKNQKADARLLITFIQAVHPFGNLGSEIITGYAGNSLVLDKTNKCTQLVDMPIALGENSISFRAPSGLDYTVKIRLNDPLINRPKDLTANVEWQNANNGNVSYGTELKASLKQGDKFLITVPWESKRNDGILVSFASS